MVNLFVDSTLDVIAGLGKRSGRPGKTARFGNKACSELLGQTAPGPRR